VSRDVRKPLTARSAVLSLLLGAHPGRLSAAELVLATGYLGITESTARVALTRAVASGDLVRTDDGYALGARLVDRQSRQDESVAHALAPWDGTWEQVVIVEAGRAAADRAALRTTLTRRRLSELREGVWMRPANLGRRTAGDGSTVMFTVGPVADPAGLAARLWDLRAWAERGEELIDELADTTEPALRLSIAADLVRHLTDDPLLPVDLLPAEWPGDRLRSVYAQYQDELRTAWIGRAARVGTSAS